MKLDLTDMLYALTFALEKVEAELLGVDTGHGKRVAALSLYMGEAAGFREEELRDFVGCCLLHDNALVEFIREELSGSSMSQGLPVDVAQVVQAKRSKMDRDHSVVGEQNIRLLPFRTDVKNIILYHHENPNGTGTFGTTPDQVPLKAQILHMADMVDVGRFRLETITADQYEELCQWVRDKAGTLFSQEMADLFLTSVPYEKIAHLQDKRLLHCLREKVQEEVLDYTDDQIRDIARFFAQIVDYKSAFTQSHSTGVAEKAERMARYYGFDDEKTIRFYFAGAMHDIGKLAVVNDILEKPGKLTADEFTEMKNHASATRYILSHIKGIPDIVDWAANHHEKLNGTGYPRGLTEKDLTFEDQLMACIDIYQALTEKRPYKDGFSHEKTMAILTEMAGRGELNAGIIRDLGAVMAPTPA